MSKKIKEATYNVAEKKLKIEDWRDARDWELEPKFEKLGTIKSLRVITNSLNELAESYEERCNKVKDVTEINIDELEQQISILTRVYKVLGNKIKEDGYDLEELSGAVQGIKLLAGYFDEVVTKIESANTDEAKIDMAIDLYSDNNILESIVRWLDRILCEIVEREKIS